MKILFCGTYMPLEIARELKYSSEAALKFQRNLLQEFKLISNVEALSYIPYIDKEIESFKECEDIDGIKVNYIKKISYKNYVNLMVNYFRKLDELLRNKDSILLYNFNYINLFTLYLARRNKVKSFLILADHDDAKSQRNILKKIIIKLYELNIKKFDGVIFLSESLSKRIQTKDKIVIEGGIQVEKYNKLKCPMIDNNIIKVMYSGSLENVSGIDIYLESIKKIKNKNIEFIFTGKGSLVELIKNQSIKDNRIKYKGMVSEEEYYKLLEEANILINSKNMNLPENINNFPSKVLEYLASGRVIISTEFSGKERFQDNIIFTKSTNDALSTNINKTVNSYRDIYLNYYNMNKERARDFSWKGQVEKIQKFIENNNIGHK